MPHDSGAFRVDLPGWLEAYGDRLLRSAYLLCGDASEAQDLVQETFLQAVKSAPRFRGDSAVYTWLHGILLNLSRRHRRKQQRLVFDEQLVQQTPAPSAAIETATDREFQAARLASALQELSPEHREVIVLRYYENLKIHEIAAQTVTSPGTVKSRLHYAMRALEKQLPNEMNLFAVEGTHNPTAP